MAKILYLSYDGMTDNLGMSQVLPYLKGLTNHGHEFLLVSFEKELNFKNKKQLVYDFIGDSPIEWIPLKYHKFPPVLSTIYDVFLAKKMVGRLLDKYKVDFIHCRSYITTLVALRLNKINGTPFIFDMRGFWVDERVDGGLWNLKNPFYKLIYKYYKNKERAFIERSKSIVSLTYAAKQEMEKWNGVSYDKSKVQVIPCCADLTLFNQSRALQFVTTNASHVKLKENLKGSFVISYLGSLGTWYMLDEMLQFFSVVQRRISNAKFLFITPDIHFDIDNQAAKYGISPLDVIKTSASRNEVPYLLSICNASLYFIKPTYSKMSSSPTKLAEIMGMGIPVITNRGVGDTDQLIEKAGAGVLINEFTLQAYENVVEELITRKWNHEKIVSFATEYFSLEHGVALYREVYKQMYEK